MTFIAMRMGYRYYKFYKSQSNIKHGPNPLAKHTYLLTNDHLLRHLNNNLLPRIPPLNPHPTNPPLTRQEEKKVNVHSDLTPRIDFKRDVRVRRER